MKQVYILRHGEKDAAGVLTKQGIEAAEAKRSALPHFEILVSSSSDRAALTAKLLTGREPRIDKRAGYAMAPQAVSDAINMLARERNLSFLDAAREYNDPSVLEDIDDQARELTRSLMSYWMNCPKTERRSSSRTI